MADVQIGYAISSEEHLPNDIVRHARLAEEAGFTYALISDHYHPWLDAQGHSPFVWSVIGGIATATEHLRLGTGVTCPTVRIHPAIIAQAAATSAASTSPATAGRRRTCARRCWRKRSRSCACSGKEATRATTARFTPSRMPASTPCRTIQST